jgi:hypothetical protein
MPHDQAVTRTAGGKRASRLALLAFTGLTLAGCGAGGVSPTPSASQVASVAPSVTADPHLLVVLRQTWAG